MFKVAVGHSEDPDSLDAIKDVLEQCMLGLGDAKPNAGVLIAAPEYEHEVVLKYINQQLPEIELIGCTSSGEISSTLGYMEGSMMLTLFSTDRVEIKGGVLREVSQEDQSDVEKTLKEVIGKSTQAPKLVLTFPEVFTSGLVKVVKEMETALGKNIPIVGAGATDTEFKFTENAQFYKTEVLHDSAPFLVFSGPISFDIASSSGWQPFSEAKLIFDHKNNVITKIGEYSAVDFFKHYLGGLPTLAYPLAIFQDKDNNEAFFLRAAIGADEEAGTVTMGADIPEVEMACSIAKADSEELIKVMRGLIEKVHKDKPNYKVAFIASCACRQAVLGSKIKKENEVINEVYSSDMPCFGLYAYGQIGPLDTHGPNLVHNETIVVVAMGEENG